MKLTMNPQRILWAMLSVLSVFVLAISVIHPELLPLGVTGVTMASTPVPGGTISATETQDTKPEYHEEDISQLVTRIEPNKYPFDTLLRHLNNDKEAHNPKVQFEEYTYMKRDFEVTDHTFDGAEPEGTMTVSNPDRVAVDNLISIPEVEVEIDGKMRELVLAVTDKNNNELTVRSVGREDGEDGDRVNIPDFDTTDPVASYRMAKAMTEMSAQTTPNALLPDRHWNYIQIMMAQIEESVIHAKMRAKSGFRTYNENQLESVRNFRSENEISLKFGIRDTGVKEGEQWWTMGGMTSFIDGTINYPIGNLTDEHWVDWTREIFADNNGSEERHLLADDMLLSDILKVNEVQQQRTARETEVVRGIRCSRIETNFGILWISFDRSLKETGRRNMGLVIDPANVRRRVYEPMHTQDLDLDKTGQKRAQAKRIVETISCEWRHQNSHRIIKGTND